MGPSKHAKDIVSVIIAKRMNKGKDRHDEGSDESKGSSSEGEHSAAEDVLQAIEDSDAEALASALKDFFRICSGDEEDSPEEEKEESKDEGY